MATQAAAAPTPAPAPKHPFWSETLPQFLNFLVIILSLGLIAFISWDTFQDVDYLENATYMKYQFAVCMVFLAEYFYRLWMSKHRLRFVFWTIPFLIISVPWLNIISYFQISVSHEALAYFCFIPIVRGLVALVMVVTFVTKTLSSTLFSAYVLVLAPIVYMSGLIFYVAEKAMNPALKNFWYALWWAGMNVTTIGCDINPMTYTGMVLSFILSLLGIIMFPLFTVYLGDVVQMYSKKVRSEKEK